MKPTLVLLLTFTLAAELCSGGQQKISAQDQIHAIAPNSPVEVRFRNGSKLRGLVGEVSDSGFVLKHEIKTSIAGLAISFRFGS